MKRIILFLLTLIVIETGGDKYLFNTLDVSYVVVIHGSEMHITLKNKEELSMIFYGEDLGDANCKKAFDKIVEGMEKDKK